MSDQTSKSSPATRSSGLALTAIRLATATIATLGVVYAIVLIAWAVGGDDAISDNVIGYGAAVVTFASFASSMLAMVLALVARSRGQRPRWSWLPLGLLPVLIVVLVAVEVLWME